MLKSLLINDIGSKIAKMGTLEVEFIVKMPVYKRLMAGTIRAENKYTAHEKYFLFLENVF